MSEPADLEPQVVDLDRVLITEELRHRLSRPPDYAAEASALAALARVLADDPRALLQTLVDLAAGLCSADSAGISVLETREGPGVFRWPAIAGMWAQHTGGSLPRDASPCGVVIDRDAPLLFDRPGRHFPDVASVTPELIQVLLVPFHVDGKPVGTVWVTTHSPGRQFVAEDARILTSLSRFASAAYRVVTVLDAVEAGRVLGNGQGTAGPSGKGEKSVTGPGHLPLAELWALVERRMGICPSFFKLASPEPSVAWGLFRLAEFAYLDSPMPPLFKETLFTYLSRFSEVRYCVARHCAFLLGRGYVSGDPACPPLTPDQAVALLQEPMPPEDELPAWLRDLEETPAPLADWPDFASDLGRRFRVACAVIFIDPHRREPWVRALRRLLGPGRQERLMLFLAFVRTAHSWTEVHMELAVEPDVEDLFREHEELARLLLHEADAPRWKLREALWESEERFRTLVEPFAEAVWETDAHGMVVADSRSWRSYTGQTVDEWLGEGWVQAVDPDDRENALRLWRRAARDVIPMSAEFRLRQPDGGWRWTNIRAAPLLDAEGAVCKWVGMNIDISERKRAEEALRASEERSRLALDAAAMGSFVWYPGDDRCEPDARMLALFGLPAEGTLSLAEALSNLIHPADRERYAAAVARATDPAGDAELREEIRVVHPGGSERWLAVTGRTQFEGTPRRAVRMAGVATDVTDRKRDEKTLAAAAARDAFRVALADALRPLSNPIAIQGAAARVLGERLQISRAFYAEVESENGEEYCVIKQDYHMPGVSTFVGRYRADDYGGTFIDELRAGRMLAVADVAQEPILTHEEREAYASANLSAYIVIPVIEDGRFVACLAVHQTTPRTWTDEEITLMEETAERIWAAVERARAEAALRASEMRLRLALAAARMGIWTWDVAANSQTRDANLNHLIGLEPVESIQSLKEFFGHIHPDDREAVAAAFDASVRHGQPLNVEFRVVRPDGAVRWLKDQGDIFRETGGPTLHMAGACVDVTDLKEVEAALRESEERLRLIVAGATDYAILTLDVDLRVTSWSPGARAIFGFTESQIVGRPSQILFTPEDRAAGAPEEEAQTALREGRAADERWHVRRDGSRFYASGVLTPLGEGGSLGFVKIASDLTERKRMEDALREARDELEARVAERTAELGRANEALKEALDARKELLRRVVSAQEDERRRVSRELHDGLGQELTALILSLKALERAVPEDALGRDRLREVEAIVGRIGREAHDLAVDLRPTALDDIGLAPALSAYVTRWSERTEIAAEFQLLGLDGDRLPPQVETTVYRVVQEALNNVVKHAEARNVSVIVERRADEVTALIEDDGRGFDPERAASGAVRRSLGVLGMRERLGLVGGTLLVESGDGEGTTVRARLPIRRRGGEAGHDG